MKKQILLILFISLISNLVFSQKDSTKKKKNDNKFVPAPYLNYSRSVGFGVGFVPLYMFRMNKKDTISPQSLIGGVGMYTSNKTYFGMGFGRFYFKEDKWRVTAAAGVGDINFQVYVDVPLYQYVDYNTNMFFSQGVIQRKISNHFYGGLVFQYMKFLTVFDISAQDFENELFSGGVIFNWDTRSSVYYPNSGNLAELVWNSYPLWFGNTSSSDKITSSYNQYLPSRNKKDVIALRAYGAFGIGDISFNQQTVVGRSDLRGYTQGVFRGDGMVDIQGEYRFNLNKKIGFVGFAGLGTIYGANNSDDNGVLLPSLGTGFRFNVFPENHMNIGIDGAVGKDDWGIYFRIGEAF